MNGYCVGAREYLEHPARERFISLSAINISFTFYIDVDGRDCRPLNIDYNTRDLVCERICASTNFELHWIIYFVRSFVTNLEMRSRSEFECIFLSDFRLCEIIFFPSFFAYSIRHDSGRRRPTTRAFLHCHRR